MPSILKIITCSTNARRTKRHQLKLTITLLATESENRLPRKLLGSWCSTGNRLRGRPLKNTRHSYLDLLNNLKFDESDPILGSNKVEQAVFLLLLMMIMRNLINVLTAVSMNWLGTGYCTLLLPFL